MEKRPLGFLKRETVEVLYDFESKTAKGHAINVHSGERYHRVADAGSDGWSLVCRPLDITNQFYLPTSYIRSISPAAEHATEKEMSSSRHSIVPHLGDRSSNIRNSTTVEPRRKSFGFKMVDPQRISNSIPRNLNFVHNIRDLAAQQQQEDETVQRRQAVMVAVPRSSLLANGSANLAVSSDSDAADEEKCNEVQRAASFSPTFSPAEKNQLAQQDEQRKHLSARNEDSHILQQHHHYENVQQLDKDRPSAPRVDEQPVRVLQGGWREYSGHNGRSYFFHQKTGICQWKPPRQRIQMIGPSEVAAILKSSGTEDDLETSGDDIKSTNDQSGSNSSEIDALCGPPPKEVAPVVPAASRAKETMTESVDSGLGRTSLSLHNKTFGLRLASTGADHSTVYDPYTCSEDLVNVVSSEGDFEPSGAVIGGRQQTMQYQQQRSIKSGVLEKAKTAEAGLRLKKREWTSCFIYLTSAHVIFYKDEKSAQKFGKHYPAPLGVCDLRGAKLSWLDKDSDKKRKHIFQLQLIDGTTYLFSTANSQDINGWFHALRQVIAKLPQPDFYPTPVLEQAHVRRDSLLGRSSSSSTRSKHDSNSQWTKTKRLPIARSVARRTSLEHEASPLARQSGIVQEHIQPTQTIIERLIRFFRHRPSIESLKEKGIYKPEPVFGSTLVEICRRERSTVPKFLRVVTEVIEAKGLDSDGLYRVSGNLSAIQKIRCQVDQDKYTALVSEDDVNVLTGALKLFFRELQEPIFPTTLTKDFLTVIRVQNVKQRHKLFDELLGKMPEVHRETLALLLKHLSKVANHASKNRMQTHNLAIVFGPNLFTNNCDRQPATASNEKGKKKDNKGKRAVTVQQMGATSNSHLAFNMIMQGQIVEYLLKEQGKFRALHPA